MPGVGVIDVRLANRHVVGGVGALAAMTAARAGCSGEVTSAILMVGATRKVADEPWGAGAGKPLLGADVSISMCVGSTQPTCGEAARPPRPLTFAGLANLGRGLTRRGILAPLVVVAMPVALGWLQPWKLFIRTTIDDTLPAGAQTLT